MSTLEPYRTEEIRRSLATDPRVLEPELDVQVRGAKVVVSGIVPTEERRQAVADVLRERCGELEIDNQVVVAAFPGAPTQETVS